MRNHQIETLTQLSDDALKVVMKAEACTVANQIMRTYVVNDNQVFNLQGFYSALVEALQKARMRGQEDRSGEDVLFLTEEMQL